MVKLKLKGLLSKYWIGDGKSSGKKSGKEDGSTECKGKWEKLDVEVRAEERSRFYQDWDLGTQVWTVQENMKQADVNVGKKKP